MENAFPEHPLYVMLPTIRTYVQVGPQWQEVPGAEPPGAQWREGTVVKLDGRVSAVVGTHTHIVTGDERILTRGTAYQTDLGMTGPIDSVIGFNPATVLPRFINALPTRFEVGEGSVVLNAAQIDVDPATGRALAIERIQRLIDV